MQKTQLMVDYTVEGILQIADMYETPLAVKKCENYLIKGSKLGSKKMLELAEKYRLEELKVSFNQFFQSEQYISFLRKYASIQNNRPRGSP
ncbi:hypothetical protein B9Z55_007812 [Caenorhabditis nigoni]|uniref:BTB domain-containing protein n=1 Tax=Caenorhabditis nigoni TaxID=1611254 RepID=A0A2G5VBG2_9PELO|nr:hypothetical protein B9Z55_007812 [Caenorhabditis nigoni]